MFGNNNPQRQFSYTSSKSVKVDRNKDIRDRMKISSFSLQDKKPDKKRLILFVIMLLLVVGFIIYIGYSPADTDSLIIQENELEKVNGQ
ncbi:MAG TPA: hypothetical protein PLK90_00210 [Clostridiales bacterium]|nr:hypothetical protein [Clostridiales bacterium]HQP68800.1 hypothetical protein [Clostridiales bacterium]